jgi:carbonic anhydrase/acetyltransferase-like protein (isoleucine patch superfamily)
VHLEGCIIGDGCLIGSGAAYVRTTDRYRRQLRRLD